MNAQNRTNKRPNNLRCARDLAFEKLKVMDGTDISRHAGVSLREEGVGTKLIQIDYLGKPLWIAIPAMTVTWEPDDWAERGGAIRLSEEIFILHYLEHASGILPTGNLIPFQRMNGGMAYNSVFKARSVGRLLNAFRDHEDILLDIGSIFGGTTCDLGNVSLRLRILPHVEIVLVFWKGDDEIPPSGNIFFDESVLGYLSTEDCVVMAETVTNRILCVLNQKDH